MAQGQDRAARRGAPGDDRRQPSAARRASGQRRADAARPAPRLADPRAGAVGTVRDERRPPAEPGPDLGSQVRRRRQRPIPPGARFAGGLVGELLRRAGDRPDAARIWGALVVGLVGALLLGVAGVSDNYLHRGVETSANAPFVTQPTGRAPATNEDLLALPADQRDDVIAQMAEYGIGYVRLPVRWAEIETEPGEFAWDDLDATLTALEAAAIVPVVTLVEAPEWSWIPGPATSGATDVPPSDATDLSGFVQALMTRYSGRLPFLQVWDAPNDPDHWGGQTPDPVGYATLLGESANAARQAAPGVRIVLAELAIAPRSGPDDLGFLHAVYRAGAADFFDVVSVVADGGDRSPFDRQVDAGRLNISRAVLTREVMLEEGDPGTPVWASHFGWDAGPGGVSAAEQADFTVTAAQRMRAEWPWMGLAFLWDFTPAEGQPAGRALAPDGQPSAALTAIRDRTAPLTGIAPTGYAPLAAPAVTLVGPWEEQVAAPAYRTSPEVGSSVEIRFDGSGLIANVYYGPNVGPIRVTLDGGPVPGLLPDTTSAGTASLLDLGFFRAEEGPREIVAGLETGTHTVRMELIGAGDFTVGGLIVTRELPTLWPVVVLAVAGLVLLFLAVREALYVLALRRGYLRRRREVDLNPAGRL